MGKPCAQCGQPLNDDARVCPQCGFAVVQASPMAAQTMLGFQSPLAKPPSQPAAPDAAATKANMQTMLGFAAPAELRGLIDKNPSQSPSPSPTPSPNPAPSPAPNPSPQKFAAQTMLGMASPLAPQAAAPPPQNPAADAPLSRFGGTMLGVAMPGIAPAHSQPGVPVPIPAQSGSTLRPRTIMNEPLPAVLPQPAPFIREAAPSAPRPTTKRGVPIAIVAVIVAVLVLGAGVAILLFARSAPPMTATAKVSADGKEQLHLRCESCKDGTTAALGNAKTTFAKQEADLPLPAPLKIGDNAFQIAIDRPGVGRDETVKLVLPLAYRIRGDLDDIGAASPVIKVDVEAQQGTNISVDGKLVTLDANGKAVLPFDVSADTTGPADETRTIEKKIPYEVTDKDKKTSTGDVAVRVAVLPLHVDAPSAAELWTEDATIWVAGRTAKNAVVTANGKNLAVAADGSFEGQVDVASGEQTIAVRAAPDPTAKAAPRTVNVKVNRVSQLAAQTKAFEKNALVGFDAFAADANAIGKSTVVVGTVADARVANHHSIVLIDDKRGCAKSPCIVRVEYGAESTLHAGEHAIAYGVIIKPITTPDGKTLPAIDASLVRPSKDPR